MERNIKLYPWFRAMSDTQAWIPVFFLYFSQFVSLEQVIQLSAVYYVSVFVLEVPSGYFSDRMGRRTTLMISALSAVLAHLIFLTTDSFEFFAIGQFLLAASIAFQSGTDTALHYDSLAISNKEGEYEAREAHAEKLGLLFLAVATLSGGLLGSIDLRLAYLLSLCGGIATLLIVLQFSEPVSLAQSSSHSFLGVLLRCIKRLQHPLLAWLFIALIIMYALAHVPFEFYQPYIQLLEIGQSIESGNTTALVSGIVISASMFGGTIGAAFSVRLRSMLGLAGLIGLALSIQFAIIFSLGSVLHAAILIMVFIRNFPMSMLHAPVNAAIAPLISSAERATFLSLQGLSQRIFFAALLFFLSITAGDINNADWPTLSTLFQTCLIVGLVGLIPIVLTYSKVKKFI